jgi:hypothetical protein
MSPPKRRDRLKWLRFSRQDSGPLGYRVRMGLTAFAPFAPMLAFDVDPRTSWLTLTWFIAALGWGAAIYAFAIRQLWASIWQRRD